MKEYYNIIDKKNQRESIQFERSLSIGTQDATYEYSDEFWD